MKHLFDNSDNNVYTKEYCNFRVGAPGPDLLEKCCEIFKEATASRMDYEKNENNSYLFQYGPTAGLDDFRDHLASFLSRNYGNPVAAGNLLLTAGASHGMHLLWTLLLDPEALIIVDDVTYMIALEAMRGFPKFRIVPCALEDDGPNLEAFENILIKNNVKAPHNNRYQCMYFTIPVYHNPTGITFSEAKNKALVALSRQYNFLIGCDDVYNLLSYPEDDATSGKVQRLYALDNPQDADYKGTVISNGSFSKIFAPGVRVGWIEGPKWAVEQLTDSGIMKSGGSVNNYMSGVMAEIIRNGRMQELLDFYRQEYQTRLQLACKILATELHPQVKFKDPRGGYFIWLVFPDGFDVHAFNEEMRIKYKVFGIAGSCFSVTGEAKNCLRLCVVFHRPEVVDKGMRQLCLAVRDAIQ